MAAGGVEIEDAGCVAISYPNFFAQIAALQETAGGSA
jgi:5-enolpyruvylshikimate-3-phosphate synthase